MPARFSTAQPFAATPQEQIHVPAITATAPGKIILFGEHAVVYGRPAIAVPVNDVRTRVVITASPVSPGGQVRIQSPAIGLDTYLDDLTPDDPIWQVIEGVLQRLKAEHIPACTIRITSTIPVAAGLGSGAAASVALIRALTAFLGQPLPDEEVNTLAYEIEKIHHATPSGIDNTVITYAAPVYFVRGQPIQNFRVKVPFSLLIADTGVPGKTAKTVRAVRAGWESNPERANNIFDRIGDIARRGREAIENGQMGELGTLMNENQALLGELGVSSPELDRLIAAARSAGAQGAKLSGGGGGGNMIAYTSDETRLSTIQDALTMAGATRLIRTLVR
jgi:mevalonate kinase